MSAFEALRIVDDREERRGDDESDPGDRGAEPDQRVGLGHLLELVVDVRELLLDRFERGHQRSDERADLAIQLGGLEPIEKVVRRARGQSRALGTRQSADGDDVLRPCPTSACRMLSCLRSSRRAGLSTCASGIRPWSTAIAMCSASIASFLRLCCPTPIVLSRVVSTIFGW